MNVHSIVLDLSKEPAHEPTIYLGQGDKNGTTLQVAMFDNGNTLNLASKTVKFCMRTPGGTDYYEVEGTSSGNVATFEIDETYAAGHVGITDIAYVSVDDGDTVVTSTSRVRVVVLPSATEGVEPAPAYISLIEQFIADAQEDIDEAVAAAQAIVDYSVPLMSANQRGGAKLGTGLEVDANEKLNNAGVIGVKGDSENDYRTGNVNLTYANLGTNGVSTGGTSKSTAADARAYMGSIPLATSSTGATAAAKEATLSGFELYAGVRVAVQFEYANTLAAALTLNVNFTGNKLIYMGGVSTSASNAALWSAGAICEFIYDGTQWHYLGSSTDGYEDYEASGAIADLATWTGANYTDYINPNKGTIQHQVDTLRDSVVKTKTVSGTTTQTGALLIGSTANMLVISASLVFDNGDVGFAFLRGFGEQYVQCYNIQLQPRANESLTAKIAYIDLSS